MKKRALHGFPLLLTIVLLVAGAPGLIRAASDLTAKNGSFEATWLVSGTVHIIDYFDSQLVGAGRLTGTVMIQSNAGLLRNFETDCIVTFDTRSGSSGHCVWTDPLGDVIYVDTRGSGNNGFGASRGVFVGGNGKYEGIKGSVQYEWSANVRGTGDTTVDGQSVRMTGNYNLPR